MTGTGTEAGNLVVDVMLSNLLYVGEEQEN